jgi:hypothetical protein
MEAVSNLKGGHGFPLWAHRSNVIGWDLGIGSPCALKYITRSFELGELERFLNIARCGDFLIGD